MIFKMTSFTRAGRGRQEVITLNVTTHILMICIYNSYSSDFCRMHIHDAQYHLNFSSLLYKNDDILLLLFYIYIHHKN
jgi:hypothetical protein